MAEQPPVTEIDIVGLIPPAVGDHPRFDVQFAQDSLPFVGDVNVLWWYTKNDETIYLSEEDTFKAGYRYAGRLYLDRIGRNGIS